MCERGCQRRIVHHRCDRDTKTCRLTQIDYPNGVVAYYDYDDANRLLEIRTEDPQEAVLFEIDYTWSINNLVTQRVEYDGLADETSTVVFDYDDRDRLISEERSGQNPYELYYTYDQLGNRLTKTDASDPNDLTLTAYFYDSDPDNRPEGYETNNNRLLWYEVWTDWTGQDEALARTVSYTYYKTGHASNITIKDESNPTHRYDLALYYARNGVLWLAAWGEYDIIEGEVENHEIIGAREFRYDNPRQRYMVRDLDTPTANPTDPQNPWTPLNSWTYTDYDGVMPYADSTIADDEGTAAFTQLSRYQSGLGIAARENIDQGQVDTTTHLHGDLIRSTNLTTDDAGDGESAVAYTAFGEMLGASGPGSPAPAGFSRYGYAGGWGYEADLLTLEGHDTNLPPVTLQHVGARWYDPSIGRFVMRDPIGIGDGFNTYAYVGNQPASYVDWSGLSKGGPRNIRPSDLPGIWDKMSKADKLKWLNNAIRNANNAKHMRALRAFLKVLKRTPSMWCAPIIAAELGAAAARAAAPYLDNARDTLRRARYGQMEDVGVSGYEY